MKKLTLSMDDRDIRGARRLAREQRTSISAMFSQLVRAMLAKRRAEVQELPPLTRKLSGMIAPAKGKTDRQMIEDAISERYEGSR